LAVRYTGRHVRQARHGAWLKQKRSRPRRPPVHLLPVAAALTVAGFLVGGASAAIGLSPASYASGATAYETTYDPADIPPPDPWAGYAPTQPTAVRAPLTSDGIAGARGATAVTETGWCEASYKSFGGPTASGEAFDPTAHTAAHKTLPLGSLVRVTNEATGAFVVVRINDRGPYYGDRCLDLTSGAFALIANPAHGVVDVRYEVLAQEAT
jgi:rare lipoprotein A